MKSLKEAFKDFNKSSLYPLSRHCVRGIVYLLFLWFYVEHSVILVSAFMNMTLKEYSATPLFEDKKGRYLTDYVNPDGTYGYWSVEEPIPERIVKAVLAIEDKRFFEHFGVDLRSLGRAFVNNLSGGTVQGGSTVPMQVARLQNPSERSFRNKLTEIYTAFGLVARFGHKKVLLQYLKIIPQGNQMHGAVYAARRYFKKPLKDLSWCEASVLAAVLKSPGKMNLFTVEGFFKAAERGALILKLLRTDGVLTGDLYRISLNELASMGYQMKESRPSNSFHYVLRLPAKYKKRADTYTKPVRVSLDLDIQDYIQRVATYAMTRYRGYGAGNIAIIVADKKDGSLLGYIGSEDYHDGRYKGAINYADTLRSSGSTLKPFLFAYGLQERYFTPSSVLGDLPFSVLNPSGEYMAGNFDDDYLGPMLYRRALANSRNIPAIRVLEKTGPGRFLDFLETLGFSAGGRQADYYGYGLAIGGLYVTLEQLIEAYGILANDGKSFRLKWLAHEQPPEKLPKLIKTGPARQMALFLSDPLARMPSFPRLKALDFPFPVAVKTGTSQGFRDAWAVAYSSKYIASVWMGHPDNEGMNRLSGSSVADLLKRIFLYLQPEAKQGINEVPFPPPPGSFPKKVCIYSGQLATLDCAHITVEYYEPGYQPRSFCDLHKHYAIDKKTGETADKSTPSENIVVKTFTVFPPEYAAWAAKQGYASPGREEPALSDTSIKIVYPLSGTRLLMDPDTPERFQTIPLRVEVEPAVSEVTWLIDGKEFKRSAYPYDIRWPLSEGIHQIQAKFARANVYSEKIFVNIKHF